MDYLKMDYSSCTAILSYFKLNWKFFTVQYYILQDTACQRQKNRYRSIFSQSPLPLEDGWKIMRVELAINFAPYNLPPLLLQGPDCRIYANPTCLSQRSRFGQEQFHQAKMIDEEGNESPGQQGRYSLLLSLSGPSAALLSIFYTNSFLSFFSQAKKCWIPNAVSLGDEEDQINTIFFHISG